MLVLVNPATPMGQPDRTADARTALAAAFATDATLGPPDRVRLVRRGFGDPVPADRAGTVPRRA